MAEWLKAAVLKTVRHASASGVRIPPHPPTLSRNSPATPGAVSENPLDVFRSSVRPHLDRRHGRRTDNLRLRAIGHQGMADTLHRRHVPWHVPDAYSRHHLVADIWATARRYASDPRQCCHPRACRRSANGESQVPLRATFSECRPSRPNGISDQLAAAYGNPEKPESQHRQ